MSTKLELAERVLALADGDAQVTVTRLRTLALPLAGATPEHATDSDVVTVQVTALVGGRSGTAITTTIDDDEALAATARRARATAAAGGAHPGLAEPEPYRTHQGHDLATARLDVAAIGAELGAAVEPHPRPRGPGGLARRGSRSRRPRGSARATR